MTPGPCPGGGPHDWRMAPRGPGDRAVRMNRRVRARFFRRLALAAAALGLLTVSSSVAVTWIFGRQFGLGGWAPALPALVVVFALGMVAVRMAGVMRRAASPLGAVMDAADRVADGDYGVRVLEHGPPPLRALAHSFNTMTERLQHADRLRRDLMADVAHELRTPLSVLQGRLEGLIDGVYPRDDRQIAQLLEETRVLARLIEDLRTVALSDAGVLQLHLESTDIVALVQDVVRSLQADATQKSVAMSVATSTTHAIVDLDPVRIREVLTNLLTNALRHTAGGQTVTVAVKDRNDGIAVDVTDTGEGMPSEEVERMFDRFYKGTASRGSGLGLAIAKGIVLAHGGEITASSQLGRGTTVAFTLPRSHAE